MNSVNLARIICFYAMSGIGHTGTAVKQDDFLHCGGGTPSE
jgi:hypothetical protein